HAIDMHELVDELAVALLAVSALRASAPFAIHDLDPLEVQAGLAGRFGERFDAPMIDIGAPVEHDVLDAGLDRPLGDQLADRLRRGEIAALRQRALQPLVEGRGGGDGLARAIVDHLRIDMLRGPEYRQSRAAVRRTFQRVAYPARAPHCAFFQRA